MILKLSCKSDREDFILNLAICLEESCANISLIELSALTIGKLSRVYRVFHKKVSIKNF